VPQSRSVRDWLWRLPSLAAAIGWGVSVWISSGPLVVLFFIVAGVALGAAGGWYYKRRHPSTARLYLFIVTFCLAAMVVFAVVR
jgi:hypothetical protein